MSNPFKDKDNEVKEEIKAEVNPEAEVIVDDAQQVEETVEEVKEEGCNKLQEEYDKLYSETGCVEVDIIGRCSVNEWNGYVTPQIIIEDYEIVDRMKYIF